MTDTEQHASQTAGVIVNLPDFLGPGYLLVRTYANGHVEADYRDDLLSGGWRPIQMFAGGDVWVAP